jgi:hypothetical protein
MYRAAEPNVITNTMSVQRERLKRASNDAEIRHQRTPTRLPVFRSHSITHIQPIPIGLHVSNKLIQHVQAVPGYPRRASKDSCILSASIRLRPRKLMSPSSPILPTTSGPASPGSSIYGDRSSTRDSVRYGLGSIRSSRMGSSGGVEAYSLPRSERGVPLLLRRLLKFRSMVGLRLYIQIFLLGRVDQLLICSVETEG